MLFLLQFYFRIIWSSTALLNPSKHMYEFNFTFIIEHITDTERSDGTLTCSATDTISGTVFSRTKACT